MSKSLTEVSRESGGKGKGLAVNKRQRISQQQKVRVPSQENLPAINAPAALRVCTDQLTVKNRATRHDAVPSTDQTLRRRGQSEKPAQLPQCRQAE